MEKKERKECVRERVVPPIMKGKKFDIDMQVPLVIIKQGAASRDNCWS